MPIQVTLPPVGGLEIISRSERTEVANGGASLSRTTVLELRLRGTTPGRWRIGPGRVRQGSLTAEADPVQVEVIGGSGVATAARVGLSPRVEAMIAAARPPATGEQASLSTILSADSAFLGQQVDVVTAAWFPRELRLQLRRPPTLQVPSLDGVWSYPQRAPAGIAASRLIDGRWYRPVRRASGRIPPHRRRGGGSARHPELQRSGGLPVLQPGGTVRGEEPAPPHPR